MLSRLRLAYVRAARAYARAVESILASAARRRALRAEYFAHLRFVRHES